MPPLPPHRRHLVDQIKQRIEHRLAPIIVIRGSRQIGKTTACLQVISDLLAQDVAPHRIFRIQFDELDQRFVGTQAIVQWVGWYEKEILKTTLNNAAVKGNLCYLFFDEVQNIDNWSTQLKFLADHSAFIGVVTGSSALRIERGRDSLAGRVNTIEAGVLSLTEIGRLRGLSSPPLFLPDNGIGALKNRSFWEALAAHGEQYNAFAEEIFRLFSERGAYPIAHLQIEAPWELMADQLNETVIRRVIRHDLRMGEKGRKRDEHLLEELFRWCCRYAGQAPSLAKTTEEMKTLLGTNLGVQRVRAYLHFLHETLLIRLVEPLEIRLKKRREPPKICLADHSLRASWLQEHIPLDLAGDAQQQDLTTMAGYLAESIVGALFSSIGGIDLAYLPSRHQQPEVDFILTIGDQRIPIEVKYRNQIYSEHYQGLLRFIEKPSHRAPFGILVTKEQTPSLDRRIVTLPLRHLMLMR